ncbi:MAG: hypothetical protein MJA31_01025 [Clostridia bacterium]|nr:hypothetical protein [Clostridia bacterium]
MKYKKTILLLVILIGILSLAVSSIGLFSSEAFGDRIFTSLYGEQIELYGKGIYHRDSVSMVAQGKAQDMVTMILGIPLLLISLLLTHKGSLRGQLLLTGTLGYFLYTYTSYVFLWMYNSLFLVYVLLMSVSFFALILNLMSFDILQLPKHFNKRLPVKVLGIFQIALGIVIALLWIGKIANADTTSIPPEGLEHYTTLVIQGLDLGFIVPIAILSGVLIIRRKPFGYLLSSIIIMKGFTMGITILAMIRGMASAGVAVNLIEIIIFSAINVWMAICMVLLLKNINI